jgi:protein involved in polysaccharide export with SLBB domain
MNLLRNLFVQWGRGVALFCALLALTGCETWEADQAQNPAHTNQVQKMDVNSDIIRVGEALSIEFLDINPSQKIEQTVQEDGTISLILDQKIIAAGKRATELQNAIHDLYVPRFFHRVTVSIKRDNRFYFVGGEVKSPGRLLYSGEMTVIKAIQSAGDFTIYANKKKIQINRADGKVEKVNYWEALKNPKKDLPIYPGDRIIVPLSPI